jgi:hypothetical protein
MYMYVHIRIDTRYTLVLLVLEYPYNHIEYGCTAVLGEIGNRVVGAYQRCDGVPFRAAVSMSYPKGMYVRRYAEPVSGLAYEY